MFTKQPLIIAHRGSRTIAPENTLPAGILAHSQGADMWEVDIRLSADNIPVLMHDESLARTTNVPLKREFTTRFPWNVTNFSYAELLSLNAGEWFVYADPFETISFGDVSEVKLRSYLHEPIPSLKNALIATKNLGWKINIELKSDTKQPEKNKILVEKTINLLNDLGMQNEVLLSSFKTEDLQLMRNLAPNIKAALLYREISIDAACDICKTLSIDIIHPFEETLTSDQVSFLREEGLFVNPWTVNNKETARNFLEAGATGIITDYPSEFLKKVV